MLKDVEDLTGHSKALPGQGLPEANKTWGYWPLEYLIDFLKFIRDNQADIEVLTYKDLCWGDDYRYEQNYPEEWAQWNKALATGRRDSGKIYLLLQYDVDTRTQRTMRLLREQEHLGVPANVMIFHRFIDRRHLRDTGELRLRDYTLDNDYLRHLEKNCGFVIGYHCNAYEQALFNMDRAIQIFEQDVAALRQRFRIDFFSAHGGVRDSQGRSNNCIHVPDSLRSSLRWVNNPHGPRVRAYFTDGGIRNQKKPRSRFDLVRAARSWKRGHRYHVVIHPQYYHTQARPHERLAGARWYEQIMAYYGCKSYPSRWWQKFSGGKVKCPWHGVRL